MSPGSDMAKPPHEGIHLLPTTVLRGELKQPFAKGRVQGASLGASDLAGLLKEVFIGTEGHVFHTSLVYTKIVYLKCSVLASL